MKLINIAILIFNLHFLLIYTIIIKILKICTIIQNIILDFYLILLYLLNNSKIHTNAKNYHAYSQNNNNLKQYDMKLE